MRITDIRIWDGDGQRILARCSIVIDEMMCINGLAILHARNGGLLLSMPRHKHQDGTYRDTAHPINKETRSYIEDKVFEAYKSKGKKVEA